jgi:GTP-binding protein
LIDISEADPGEPFLSYTKLRNELELYNPGLKERPEMVVFNKIDLVEDSQKMKALQKAWKGREVFFISCMTGEHLPELMERVFAMLEKTPAPQSSVQIVKRVREKTGFTIKKMPDHYVVEGHQPERMVAMTDFKNEHAVEVLQRKLKYIGVEEALIAEGAQEGDTIVIGSQEFDFSPEL